MTGKPSLRPDVSLGELRETHAPNMYRWMLDPAVRGGIGLKSEPSEDKTLAWIRRAASDPLIRPFAILAAGAHVGNVVLDEIDHQLGSARLSIYLGEPGARRTGIGFTAVSLAVTEGFVKLELNRIWLTVHCKNFAALNTYTRVGFAIEGILHEGFLLEGVRVDAFLMALLKSKSK